MGFPLVLPKVTSLTSPMVAQVGNAGCQAGLTWQVVVGLHSPTLVLKFETLRQVPNTAVFAWVVASEVGVLHTFCENAEGWFAWWTLSG